MFSSKDRFLAAYQRKANVRAAAQLAQVHRATIYRWKASDPAFAARWAAIDEARDRAHRTRIQIAEEQRLRRRAQRLKELHPIYCQNAARARAAKAAYKRS